MTRRESARLRREAARLGLELVRIRTNRWVVMFAVPHHPTLAGGRVALGVPGRPGGPLSEQELRQVLDEEAGRTGG